MKVRASAYNSLANQTSSNPFITAFGDSIKPGDNYIAVSRNLLWGPLKENTIVSIEGLDSLYIVKDKMNRRYWNTIDVYMGLDVKAARKWGRRNVTICYQVKVLKDSIVNQP
ncbi:3D domain-containing protein [Winogradskyella sp. A3E31]|uniref:3D domain-containing protein n=1 Tax=Winogradskyella sp. A3E31 TaxID=3349637 RepID=UPI00398B3D6D